MELHYETDTRPSAAQVIALYDKAGLPRPTDDPERIQKMYESSNLVISAWHNQRLVAVCRGLTDWVWCCYLSDLAVDPDYQKNGLGKKLIALAKEKIGDQSMLLLLSVPQAMAYYPKIGFIKEDRGFIINRKK